MHTGTITEGIGTRCDSLAEPVASPNCGPQIVRGEAGRHEWAGIGDLSVRQISNETQDCVSPSTAVKSFLLTILLASVSLCALAQGSLNFANFGGGLNAPVTDWDGSKLVGHKDGGFGAY